MTLHPRSRFAFGRVVRYRGSPYGARRERTHILAIVESVGRPGPQQELRVRLETGGHFASLAEHFVPVRVLPRRAWRRACAARRADLACAGHDIIPVPAASASRTLDTRSDGAKRYDDAMASRVPDWASLGYLSQNEMDVALA